MPHTHSSSPRPAGFQQAYADRRVFRQPTRHGAATGSATHHDVIELFHDFPDHSNSNRWRKRIPYQPQGVGASSACSNLPRKLAENAMPR